MAPDQIEQELDELKRRVERLEAKERDRMAEHDRLEEVFQKAVSEVHRLCPVCQQEVFVEQPSRSILGVTYHEQCYSATRCGSP